MTRLLDDTGSEIIAEVVGQALDDAGYEPAQNISALLLVIMEQALLVGNTEQVLDEVVDRLSREDFE